jgi:hypothetical protein
MRNTFINLFAIWASNASISSLTSAQQSRITAGISDTGAVLVFGSEMMIEEVSFEAFQVKPSMEDRML